jgi:hypothetical protein
MKNKDYFELNDAQLAVVHNIETLGKKTIYLEWGRGTGKSFILGYIMLRMVQQMPKASFAFVGPSYQQILSKMLPSTKKALELINIFEDIDYVVGKNGERFGFEKPMYKPDKWENTMHWSNGAVFQFVSIDQPSSGRGLNSFGEVGDEAALFDYEKLYYNVKLTNRAKEEKFKNKSLFGCRIYASSTPLTKKGKWFIDKEKECALPENRKTHVFIKASAEINRHNLRAEYWDEAKKEAPSDIRYRAEYLNERPKEILDGFYPQFKTEKHCYTKYNNDYLLSLTENYTDKSFNCLQDADVEPTVPLRLSIDWGIFLGSVTAQKFQKEFRTINNHWVKGERDEEDLINNWCDYYEAHQNKFVYLYYGHDGNATLRKNTRETYGDKIANHLRKRGWIVYDQSKGKPPARHNTKYILLNTLLKQNVSRYPKLTFNEPNNQDLIISIERSEAKEGTNGIEKVKKDERNSSMKQEHTTHLSDAWDIMVYEEYKDVITSTNDSLDLPLTL